MFTSFASIVSKFQHASFQLSFLLQYSYLTNNLSKLFLKWLCQIKGISELLEGLIPYSQRHFTRIDRLVRSSFLLDYTLTRMSVLDPDSDSLSTVEDPILPDNKTLSPTNPPNNIQEETVSSRKKRKSSKSKKGLEKKAKSLNSIET